MHGMYGMCGMFCMGVLRVGGGFQTSISFLGDKGLASACLESCLESTLTPVLYVFCVLYASCPSLQGAMKEAESEREEHWGWRILKMNK